LEWADDVDTSLLPPSKEYCGARKSEDTSKNEVVTETIDCLSPVEAELQKNVKSGTSLCLSQWRPLIRSKMLLPDATTSFEQGDAQSQAERGKVGERDGGANRWKG
jgi:hypothetical protein